MSYITNLLPFIPVFALIAAALYAAAFVLLKKRRARPKIPVIIAEYLLVGWLVLFIYITQIMSFGNGAGLAFNFRPFHMFVVAFRYGTNNTTLVWQFLLNIIMFVPLGILLPIVFPKKCASWPRVLSVSFSATLITELIQMLTSRNADIDDIIANTAGGAIGYGLFAITVAVIHLIKRGANPIVPRKIISAAVGLALIIVSIIPFAAVVSADGKSEFGRFYYGNTQPRYVEITGEISRDGVDRAVYKYAPHIEMDALKQNLIAATDFNGQFEPEGRFLRLSDDEHKTIDITIDYRTWSIHYHFREKYVPSSAVTENEAIALAWTRLSSFGITASHVKYEPDNSDVGEDFRLEFSSIESGGSVKVTGEVTVYLAADGEIISVSDRRIWCEYVRDVACISPYDSIRIAQEVGRGEWDGTAYVASVEGGWSLIEETGYLIPTWKINADFIAKAGYEYKWHPQIDAVK